MDGFLADWSHFARVREDTPDPSHTLRQARRDKDEADADDDDDLNIIMSVCLSRNIISRRVFRSVPRCCKNDYVDKEKCDRG